MSELRENLTKLKRWEKASIIVKMTGGPSVTLREFASDLLELSGHKHTKSCTNGYSCINRLRAKAFDLFYISEESK